MSYKCTNPNPLYGPQNYQVSGLCPASKLLDARRHDISESGSVSILRCRNGPLESVNLNHRVLYSTVRTLQILPVYSHSNTWKYYY
jgi:hypothetical protein